ncbi:hypothetical protein [Guyparkeria sp.]|uniref:hypothetical protein n=1 Tax=Guyparkeria sp. TaxID=2035736 RepID=UPI003970B516
MELTNQQRAEDLLLRVGAERVQVVNGLSGPVVTIKGGGTAENIKARQLRPELVAFVLGAALFAKLEFVLKQYQGENSRLRHWLRANPAAADCLVEHFTRKHGQLEINLGKSIAAALEAVDPALVFDAGNALRPNYIRQLKELRREENREVRNRLNDLLVTDRSGLGFRTMPEGLAEDVAAVAILADLSDWGKEGAEQQHTNRQTAGGTHG